MNIASKLTSRKFWVAVAGLVVGVLALFKVDANTTTQISGVVMALGSVIAYIAGEGLVDAASAGATINVEGDAHIEGVTSDQVVAAPATAAEQTTAGSAESGAVAPDTTGAK